MPAPRRRPRATAWSMSITSRPSMHTFIKTQRVGIVWLVLACFLRVTVHGQQPVTISGTPTITATNLDVQSGGADLATAAQLTTLDGRVDGLEALVDGLEGSVDGLEALLGTTNTSLAIIDNLPN